MPHHPTRTTLLALALAATAFGLGVISTHALAPAVAEDQPAKPAAPEEEAEAKAQADTEATTDELSYTLGYVISHRLGNLGVELDVAAFADGFKTARSDAPLKVSEQRMQELLDKFSAQRGAELKPATSKRDDKRDEDTRTAEQKRKAMAEQMQQRSVNAPAGGGPQLQIGGQVPKGRINAAVDTTQRVTREADAPEVREQQ